MILGIIPNITKEKISGAISVLVDKLVKHEMKFLLSNEILNTGIPLPPNIEPAVLVGNSTLASESDVLISIGGDGTMLHTAFSTMQQHKPIIGINFGKLGFLAEFNLDQLDVLLKDLKEGNFQIEERIVLEGDISTNPELKLFGINDIVIEKGGWPKMIEISLKVDENYVTTFAADGIILATPTGSTGYSLSTGGPIVTPSSDVIALSPISPHSLTMRPLILASDQKVYVKVKSLSKKVQISCDGERVFSVKTPLEVVIYKSSKKIKLIKTHSTNYFTTLREKLFWGMDARNKIFEEGKI